MYRFSLVLLLLASCSADPEPTPEADPFADVVFDTQLFGYRTPDNELVPALGGEAASGQVIVLLDDLTEPGTVADALSATLVGQIPVARVYQLALVADDEIGLMAARDAALTLPGVEHAALNMVVVNEVDRPRHCEEHDDNYTPQGANRCAFETVQAYSAAILMSEVAPLHPLHPVRIAVIDTGLGPTSGQFDDVDILNLDGRSLGLTDEHGHGTSVAGLIAADNHDGGPNGIATRALGARNVQLLIGKGDRTWFGRLVSVARAAGDAGADAVNMSWAHNYDPFLHAAESIAASSAFERVFSAYPDTMFIMAAGNEDLEISVENYVPGGIQLPNTLTVGSNRHCVPGERWSYGGTDGGSNYGGRVDLSAPGHAVPVIAWWPKYGVDFPEGEPVYYDGTSFSAPIVAAMVGVMRSIDPTITVSQMKDYLRIGLPTDLAIGGVVPQLAEIVGQQLVDMGVSGRLETLLDADETPAEADPVPLTINRICGGAHLRVAGLGSWNLPATDDSSAIQLLDSMFQVGVGSPDAEEISLIALIQDQPFALNTSWSFTTAATGMITSITLEEGGPILSGNISFTRCTVLERWDGLGDGPAVLEIEGQAAGIVNLLHWPSGFNHSESFEASFVALASVLTSNERNIESIEQGCEGGRSHP